jgi:mRNA interferase MazF
LPTPGRAPSGGEWQDRSQASTRIASETLYDGLNRFPNLTQMRRGDLVAVAAAGDYGKPRPAVIVQTDAFPESHASVVVCQLTSELADAPDFRVTIDPSPENGLRLISQVMADKPVTIRRERVGPRIGRLGDRDMARLGAALAFVVGLAD